MLWLARNDSQSTQHLKQLAAMPGIAVESCHATPHLEQLAATVVSLQQKIANKPVPESIGSDACPLGNMTSPDPHLLEVSEEPCKVSPYLKHLASEAERGLRDGGENGSQQQCSSPKENYVRHAWHMPACTDSYASAYRNACQFSISRS